MLCKQLLASVIVDSRDANGLQLVASRFNSLEQHTYSVCAFMELKHSLLATMQWTLEGFRKITFSHSYIAIWQDLA